MDLKDFIKNTITSISGAIEESQNELNNKDVIVNPKFIIKADGGFIINDDLRTNLRYVQNIGFDIQVIAEEKKDSNLGGGLKVVGLNIGGAKGSEHIHQNTNRIKFSIPIKFSTVDD